MWKLRKNLVVGMLPTQPIPFDPEYWWRVQPGATTDEDTKVIHTTYSL
jgi:hypothetical protein